MTISLVTAPFNAFEQLQTYQARLDAQAACHYGAAAIFIGTMRDFNQDDDVIKMRIEHYPGMTERVLTEQAQHIQAEYNVLDILLIHRVGLILPNESIVLVAAWSAHRAAAFSACRALTETLKTSAPFWKCETLKDGTIRWVMHNTTG